MLTPKKILILSLMILGIMGYVYASNIFIEEWRKLDSEIKDFVPAAGLTGIALFLMAIRNVKGVNKFLILSMEVLIPVALTSIVGLKLLMKDPLGQSLFGGGIMLFSVGWFIYFYFKTGKTDEEKEDIKKAKPTILMMFLVLMSYGIISFVTIENLQDLLP
ncbi:hypothetical protein [Nitrosopumilus sp.]|uniref:hypothetical protein n=1 Tax=Nitrosopumilus sp. TaxID=2024843 RepID=UPI00247C0AB4|nr:hypothetical protein [Nitrosopumilus sp.]MCV0430474.1 hypothetical protein [Nitrosopumilus sp.]